MISPAGSLVFVLYSGDSVYVSLLKWHVIPNADIFLAAEAKLLFLVHTFYIFFSPAKLRFFNACYLETLCYVNKSCDLCLSRDWS